MSILTSQLKVGDSYTSKSGKGDIRTISFLGQIEGNDLSISSGVAYIQRSPKNVPYTPPTERAIIDQTAREATTLHITTRQSFAKWATYKVLI